jgi:hypothetical protein
MKKCLTEELVLIILYSYIWGLNHKKYKMNLKSFKVAAAAMVMVGMVFTGCTGEDGDDGPAGNANVQSFSYTLADTSWTQGRATIAVPALTKSIADNGHVAVYYTNDSLSTDTISWRPLPYDFRTSNGSFIISNTYQIGQINITALAAYGNLFSSSIPGVDTYWRVVLIPSSAKVEGVNTSNYEEVKAVYGIQEFDVR